jgi:BirA family biotin operon repressor/biotin-[acetyl-CoA-carboxylase] ligase
MTNLPTSAGIAGYCRSAARQVAIEVVDETGSTNADLLARLDRLATPTLLIAHAQTAGRGRAGRPWLSERGKSLTFSLAWKFQLPLQALLGLPLAVGVALAEGLAMFDVGVRLKWPNDVLHDGRKLAGILIESATAGTASWAVIGIGINIALDRQTIERIGQPAAGIPWLAEVDQDMLMGTLLNALAEAMTEFERAGLPAFVDRWNALHAHAGQRVAILDHGQVLHEGVAAGVDRNGRFLLDTDAGRIAVIAGDVSLRRV